MSAQGKERSDAALGETAIDSGIALKGRQNVSPFQGYRIIGGVALG